MNGKSRQWMLAAMTLTASLGLGAGTGGGLVAAAGGPQGTALVRHMSLQDLCENADGIFRGTVIDVAKETIEAGGARIPVLRYRIRVAEGFHGSAVAGSEVELRMLDPNAGAGRTTGNLVSVGLFEDFPHLAVGGDYLLFTTRPSAVGLSTTVGLGQGLFRVRPGHDPIAVNERDNVGLFRGMAAPSPIDAKGPMHYRDLSGHIRRLIRSR